MVSDAGSIPAASTRRATQNGTGDKKGNISGHLFELRGKGLKQGISSIADFCILLFQCNVLVKQVTICIHVFRYVIFH